MVLAKKEFISKNWSQVVENHFSKEMIRDLLESYDFFKCGPKRKEKSSGKIIYFYLKSNFCG